jgi:hypothetical protein
MSRARQLGWWRKFINFKKAISRYAAGNTNSFSMNLDVFDQQDLSVWTHVVHRAFTDCEGVDGGVAIRYNGHAYKE